ncbi:D-alanine-D-alanine ligase [Flavobacteriales bacterium]|nr:D-alanine--D-alanine ligase B [Flavobacteriales bacterium]MCL4816935.1 D-alanine--D-alanine ligase [Flavobacteriales bacterium]WKZ75995.1 MAG: D-alanine--D-alanine ligase [Vicingaceae bacterium]GIK70436.1 MAG: D-alanine--D-alanine ligase [Bacteroidota bacterium]CAG0981120.1 D-alanine-D-alanine ligase [Flavobacteriales bacterium]
MKKNIAIVAGGFSSESEISLKSAAVVKKYLNPGLYNCYIINITENHWIAEVDNQKINIDKNDFSVTINKFKITFDAVFNAIHGSPGENGLLPSYFEMLQIPYTGPSPLAAALTFNKWFCNTFLKQAEILCAASVIVKKGEAYKTEKILSKTGLPCFVKPNNGGSSFGVTKVKKAEELEAAIHKALEHDCEAIVESFLEGKEVTCGVYKYQGKTIALPITEIISNNEFFDYAAKYKGESAEITPANIPTRLYSEIQNITVNAFNLLGLKSFARIDFILVNNKPFLLEVNTVPGLSEQSIVPQQVKASGMELSTFFGQLLEAELR